MKKNHYDESNIQILEVLKLLEKDQGCILALQIIVDFIILFGKSLITQLMKLGRLW